MPLPAYIHAAFTLGLLLRDRARSPLTGRWMMAAEAAGLLSLTGAAHLGGYMAHGLG